VLSEVDSYGHWKALFQNSLEINEIYHKTPECRWYQFEIRTPFILNINRERYRNINLVIKIAYTSLQSTTNMGHKTQ
jgi:hypothetical protein